MWRFFSKLGSLFRSADPATSARVTDEDSEFTFREKPATPLGLEPLRVERIEPGNTLLLTGFDAALTVDQTYLDDTPAKVASATRSLRWAVKYHGLDTEPAPPVRLHRGNVAFFPRHLLAPAVRQAEPALTAWLDRFAWDARRPLRFEQATTTKPVEDGFLRCVRVFAAGCVPNRDGDARGPTWRPYEPGPGSLADVLTRFMEDEIAKVGTRSNGCEQFLVNSYAGVPPERLTHPAFALLCFPHFDMGCVEIEFGGSVWSPGELRFWSRPAYFHK
jgi:hypothetical protein